MTLLLLQVSWDKESLRQLAADDGRSLADIVAMEVGSIGENMAIRRAVFLRSQPSGLIGIYVHSTGTLCHSASLQIRYIPNVVSFNAINWHL